MECRFKRAVLSALFLTVLVSMAYADCRSERSGYIKEKHRCISLFRKAYAPENLPKNGMLELNNGDVAACFDKLNYDYEAFSDDGSCNRFVPKELESNFKKFTKACLHRFDRNGCDALFEKSKVDNIRNADGATLLMIAAREGDVNAIDYLVSKGANVNKVDHSGRNALMYALAHDGYPVDDSEEIAVVKKILDLGVHPQELDLDGNSSLMYAVNNNSSLNVIQMLIDKGANVNLSTAEYFSESGEEKVRIRNPFWKSILWVKDNYVDLFIKNGADAKESYVWDHYYLAMQQDSLSTEGKKLERIGKLLLKSGANPNYRTDKGSSVAVWAFLKNMPSLCDAFFNSGLNVNEMYIGKRRWNPMGPAIRSNKIDVVKMILSHKYDLNIRMDKNGYAYNIKDAPAVDDDGAVIIDALGLAIGEGNVDIVKLLLGKKVNVNTEYKEKSDMGEFYTPLYYAVEKSNVEIVKLLIKAGANPNKVSGWMTPLFVAVALNNEEMVKILISAKADVNAVQSENVSLLEFAESQSSAEIVELLKKAGARKPFRGNFVDFCLNPDLTEKDVLDAFKDGADVNEVDEEQGWTPLHSVAQNGKNPKVMSILIKKGAFVNAMTKSGFTPFLSAARHNPNPEFLKMLIAAGADVEAKSSDGWQALQIAVAHNSPAVVALLLKTSLAEDLSESSKNTLIRTAVYNNPDPRVLIALFKAGYKAEPENSWMEKPLHTALENKKSVEIIKVLLQGHALVDDKAMRLARDLPMDSQDEKKYRNQVIDLLTKAKKKQK